MQNAGIYVWRTFQIVLFLLFLQKWLASICRHSQLVLKLFYLLLKLRFLFKLLWKSPAHYLILVLLLLSLIHKIFIFFYVIIKWIRWIRNIYIIICSMMEILILKVILFTWIGIFIDLFINIYISIAFYLHIIRILLQNFFWYLLIGLFLQKFWYYIIIYFHKIRNIFLWT